MGTILKSFFEVVKSYRNNTFSLVLYNIDLILETFLIKKIQNSIWTRNTTNYTYNIVKMQSGE